MKQRSLRATRRPWHQAQREQREQRAALALQDRMYAAAEADNADAWGVDWLPYENKQGGGWLVENAEGDKWLYSTVKAAEAAWVEQMTEMGAPGFPRCDDTKEGA